MEELIKRLRDTRQRTWEAMKVTLDVASNEKRDRVPARRQLPLPTKRRVSSQRTDCSQ